MAKKWIIKGITGGFLFFFLGWIVYGILLGTIMDNQYTPEYEAVMRPDNEMVWWAMIAGSLAIGFLLSFPAVLLGNPTRLMHTLSSAGVGFLYTIAVDFTNYSMMDVTTLGWILADIVIFTVMAAIIGFLISFVGNSNKTP